VVGGTQDVTLTIPGYEGFELIVKANSVTFPDGSRVGPLVVSPVNNDRLPMVPPGGSPSFGTLGWTIQPTGTRFDPPAQVKIPNPGKMEAGETVQIVQWDHDLATFVPMGRGTVSEDRAQIVTDFGSGISKAGWGGCVGPDCPLDDAPQCGFGGPSCRGSECSTCGPCAKLGPAAPGTCPACIPRTESEIQLAIDEPPVSGQPRVDVTMLEPLDTSFTIRTSGATDALKRWELESERAIEVRLAGVHRTYPQARTLTCSSKTWANPYYYTGDSTDVVTDDIILHDNAVSFIGGSNALITNTQTKLKVSVCYERKTVEKTVAIRNRNPTRDQMIAGLNRIATNAAITEANQISLRGIACHEANGRQFNTNTGDPVLNGTGDGGTGIMQVTDDPLLSCGVLWDWKENLRVGTQIFQSKFALLNTYESSESSNMGGRDWRRNNQLRNCLINAYNINDLPARDREQAINAQWTRLIGLGATVVPLLSTGDPNGVRRSREVIRLYNGGRQYKYVGFAMGAVPANELCGHGHWNDEPRHGNGPANYVCAVLAACAGTPAPASCPVNP